MKNNIVTKCLIIGILILGLALRVYKLDSVPPSISWDEAAVGYNSWTIANYGRDEYGKFFPAYFSSFGEDKNPIDIYLTAFFVRFMGLNELSTRLSIAVFGVLNVFLLYILAKLLFEKEYIGLLAAFFLAISPFNIHFSRFNHEANLALFFLIFGLILFLLSIKKGKKLLLFATLSFCLSFLSYNPAKLIVPAILLFLIILYRNELIQKYKQLIPSLIILGIFLMLILINPRLLGGSRISQNIQGRAEIEKTPLFKLTQNELLGRVNLIAIQYTWHFSPQFLFISGDKNPRLSSQSTGEFYKLDALFLLLGLIYLLKKRNKESLLLLGLSFFAPLPSSMAAEAPHAGRSMFMMGSWHIISALGFYSLIIFLRKSALRWIAVLLVIIVLAFSLKNYLIYFHGEYIKRYAIEWQYGMKQIVEFVKQHEEYNQVFVTDIRSQPYIFFLYYLKLPLPDYLYSVIHNNNLENRSHNNVASFDRFSFGGWDTIESLPKRGVLYVITPSQYDGLRNKSLFDVSKIIYYPNGAEAFYLVSGK